MGAGWGANGMMRNGLGPGGMPNGLGGLGGGLAGLGINEYGLANGLVGDNQALLSSMGLSNLAASGCEQLPTKTFVVLATWPVGGESLRQQCQ